MGEASVRDGGPAPETARVQAAGGVLWRHGEQDVEVALVHRPKYDDWSLPKGKREPGEVAVVTALREVAEETGFQAVAGRTLDSSRYRVLDHGRDVTKSVRWWSLRCGTGAFEPSGEVDELDWLTVPEAIERLTTGHDAAPLKAFVTHPPETLTVLLLRHASAGSRERWTGGDADRPLDREGVRQARGAAEVLAGYAPERVLSAPAVRCLQSVAPTAARLELPLELDPDLTEQAEVRLAPRVRGLVKDGRSVALCSQGGVLPVAVQELAHDAGLELPAVPCAKGSLWTLSWSGDVLVDADYLPSVFA